MSISSKAHDDRREGPAISAEGTVETTNRPANLADERVCRARTYARAAFVAFAVIFVCLFLSARYAFCAPQTAPFTCGACHQKAPKALPLSHKGYDMKNTSMCFVCHRLKGKAKPLGEKIHLIHMQRGSDPVSDCLSCHAATAQGEVLFPGLGMKAAADRMTKLKSLFVSAATSEYLDHRHGEKGISCPQCHSSRDYIEGSKEPDPQAQCVKCHGDFPEMAKKTANASYEQNPHKTHLPDLECSACHHGHRAFEDACSTCHNFGFKAPKK